MKDTRGGDWMVTYSGQVFWPLDPRPEEIHIKDIAHGLSMICRFNGHVSAFYSVAEHSVHVSTLVPPEHAMAGLLHDAPEAFLGDMIRPIKRCMPTYREAEDRLWRVIAGKFGLPVELPPCVKEADNVMLMTERRDLIPNFPSKPWTEDKLGIQPAEFNVECMSPEKAREAFMDRFEFLNNHPRRR
jgi:hypothetical protein